MEQNGALIWVTRIGAIELRTLRKEFGPPLVCMRTRLRVKVLPWQAKASVHPLLASCSFAPLHLYPFMERLPGPN
jgi:hypothetical protein